MRTLRASASVAVLLAAGCAHWGGANVASGPPEPAMSDVSATYLAAARPPLPANAVVRATAEPPPADALLLATARVHCAPAALRSGSCLHALLEEARRLGGDRLYGVSSGADGTGWLSLAGTVALSGRGPIPTLPGGWTAHFGWSPPSGVPAFDVFLEREEQQIVLHGPSGEIPAWSRVCKLPCDPDLDADARYRLHAPALGSEGTIDLARPPPVNLQASAQVRTRYTWVAAGAGILLVGLVAGAVGIYGLAAPHSCCATAWGIASTVGVGLAPWGLVFGIPMLAVGPWSDASLSVQSEP